MAKYFVAEGLEFQTVELLPVQLDSAATGSTHVDACTLESVVTALGDTIVMGANIAAQITTIRGWWTETGITDTFQKLAREILNANAPLVVGAIRGRGEATTNNFHQLAHQYILPPYVAEGISVLSSSSTSTTRTQERNRIAVEALSVRHDNIIKHDSAAGAWEAWVAYYVAVAAQDDLTAANRGYLINPTG